MYDNIEQIIILLGVILIVFFILYLILKNPFKYPYFKYYFDISGKRNPDAKNLLDNFLNQGNFFIIKEHNEKIEQWKIECKKKDRKEQNEKI